LKKKFDDIFSATRYTRALEAIRKLKNEQTQTIKEHKLKLEALQGRQDQAMRLRGDLEADDTKAKHLKGTMQDDEQNINEHKRKRDQVDSKLSSIQAMADKVTVLSTKKDMKQMQHDQMYHELKDLIEEPLEELLQSRGQFDESIEKLNRNQRTTDAKVNRKKMDIEKVREGLAAELKAESKLRAEVDATSQPNPLASHNATALPRQHTIHTSHPSKHTSHLSIHTPAT